MLAPYTVKKIFSFVLASVGFFAFSSYYFYAEICCDRNISAK